MIKTKNKEIKQLTRNEKKSMDNYCTKALSKFREKQPMS
jgi:hypothetical protein